MEILVAYDVSTETAAGRRRLRRVADVCEGHGQRVQKSVFECTLTDGQYELMMSRLLREISPSSDSLRIYRLREPRERFVHAYGKPLVHDMHDPLVL